jgi:hypothetical protein
VYFVADCAGRENSQTSALLPPHESRTAGAR